MSVKRFLRRGLISCLVLSLVCCGILISIIGHAYYQTRNMRALVEQIDKSGWQDYSYNIWSHSISNGYYQGKIWGPENEFLYLGVMKFQVNVNETTFYQIGDISICPGGTVKIVDFVEEFTEHENLKLGQALLYLNLAERDYRAKIKDGIPPKLPAIFFDEKVNQCTPKFGVSIPERTEKTISYP